MASVSSQLIEEVTAHAQRDSIEEAREIFADGTYFPINLRMSLCVGDRFVCRSYYVHLVGIKRKEGLQECTEWKASK